MAHCGYKSSIPKREPVCCTLWGCCFSSMALILFLLTLHFRATLVFRGDGHETRKADQAGVLLLRESLTNASLQRQVPGLTEKGSSCTSKQTVSFSFCVSLLQYPASFLESRQERFLEAQKWGIFNFAEAYMKLLSCSSNQNWCFFYPQRLWAPCLPLQLCHPCFWQQRGRSRRPHFFACGGHALQAGTSDGLLFAPMRCSEGFPSFYHENMKAFIFLFGKSIHTKTN